MRPESQGRSVTAIYLFPVTTTPLFFVLLISSLLILLYLKLIIYFAIMHLFSQFLFGVALVSAQTFEEIFANMQAHQLRFGPLPIAYSRIDAIVNPGVDILSGHLHTIIGPDTFNSNSTSDQLRTGKCTSVNAGSSNSDMSAYVLFSQFDREV